MGYAGRPDKAPQNRLPGTIWAVGFVSMFMDISSEMIHSILPVFLVTVIGASAMAVGFIEGVAEATAMITKVFSGALSDHLGKRKMLVVAGYGLAALTKPLFAVSTGAGLIFTARFLDRFGKGIRGAPRDALVADVSRSDSRGAAYGLRQALDTLGACLGPLLAMILMLKWHDNFRGVFWIATLPALAAVAILMAVVKDPERLPARTNGRRLGLRDIGSLNMSYWMTVIFGSIFGLSRYSEAFLLLRAESVGLAPGIIPAMLTLMNVVYFLTVYPAGRLSDRIGRVGMMGAGLSILILSNLTLAIADTGYGVAAGIVFWGLHMGLTQGILAAMVADNAPRHLRGTAFGIFNLAGGIALLGASITAGWLWNVFGARATFFTGAGIAMAALVVYVIFRKRLA